MMGWLDRIPFPPLVIAALLLALAPFVPEPHLLEKDAAARSVAAVTSHRCFRSSAACRAVAASVAEAGPAYHLRWKIESNLIDGKVFALIRDSHEAEKTTIED